MNEALVYAVCLVVWFVVVAKAVRERADLEVLALILIVTGLVASGLLQRVEVPAPFALAFMGAGIILLALWPRTTRNR